MFHSIRSKIFLAIVSITLITALAITVAFYFKSSQMVEDNYGDNLYGRIEQIGNSFDDSLKEIYYITVQASYDAEILDRVELFKWTENERILEEIAGLLRAYKRRYSDIGSVYLVIPDKGVIVTSQDYPVYEKGVDEKCLKVIKELADSGDLPGIVQDPLRSSSKFLSYVYELGDGKQESSGYLMTNVEERTIFYKYLDGLFDQESFEAMILNEKDEIVSSKNADAIGTVYENEGFVKQRVNGVVNSRRQQELGVFYKTTFSGYHFLMIVPKSEILRDLNQLKYFLAAFLLLFLVISLIPAYFITRRMYRPLRNLTNTMKQVSQGELEERVMVTTDDEIGNLSENFNNMLDHINQLIEQVVKEGMLKKDAELEALQYQITPHFMYNTLNSIKYAALIKGEKELGGMISDFVELLQASINKKGTFITVADELHILENYIRLQRFRYEGSLNVDYDCSQEAGGCFIPRLILQPMVENSILHGLDIKNGNSRIMIRVSVGDDTLYLSVEDNGRGMSREQMDQLLTNKAKKTNGLSGIGVANVRERLELYYGKKGGISYESGVNGTTAYLYMPAYREQNEYSI